MKLYRYTSQQRQPLYTFLMTHCDEILILNIFPVGKKLREV